MVLVGIKLIIFIGSGMVLHFKFVTKVLLSSHPCFIYCRTALTQHWGPFFTAPHTVPPLRTLVIPGKLAGDTQVRQPTSTYQRDVLCHMMSWWAKKTGRKKEEAEQYFQSDSICRPKSLLHVIETWFPEDGWTPAWPWEAVNKVYFVFFAHEAFVLHIKLYLNPWAFTFVLVILFPIPLWEVGVWGWATYWD